MNNPVENVQKWVVQTCHRIKMESQAVIQPQTQANFFSIESPPSAAQTRRSCRGARSAPAAWTARPWSATTIRRTARPRTALPQSVWPSRSLESSRGSCSPGGQINWISTYFSTEFFYLRRSRQVYQPSTIFLILIHSSKDADCTMHQLTLSFSAWMNPKLWWFKQLNSNSLVHEWIPNFCDLNHKSKILII